MALLVFMLASALIRPSDAMHHPLTDQLGDKKNGERIFHDRGKGHCLLCHSLQESEGSFQGNIAPELSGVGRRLTLGQLRLRVVDNSEINPSTIMPPYFRTEDLVQVAQEYRSKTVLSAQEVEDLVAYLGTLKGSHE